MELIIELQLDTGPQKAWVTIGKRTKEYKYSFLKRMSLNDIIHDHDSKL